MINLDSLFQVLTFITTAILVLFSINIFYFYYREKIRLHSFFRKLRLIGNEPIDNGTFSHIVRTRIKRIFDVVFSLICIFCLVPSYLLIIIFIKINSKGPALYLTRRKTIFGNDFLVTKFRTFVIDKNGAVRVTPFGRFLIKTRLDTLPMFFDVLIGKMTLVGTTTIPFSLELSKEITVNDYLKAGSIKPGAMSLAKLTMSLPAQLFRDNELFNYIYLSDSIYIKKSSILFDIYIILKTMVHLMVGSTIIHQMDEFDKADILKENIDNTHKQETT